MYKLSRILNYQLLQYSLKESWYWAQSINCIEFIKIVSKLVANEKRARISVKLCNPFHIFMTDSNQILTISTFFCYISTYNIIIYCNNMYRSLKLIYFITIEISKVVLLSQNPDISNNFQDYFFYLVINFISQDLLA